jgi:hypothetical protein
MAISTSSTTFFPFLGGVFGGLFFAGGVGLFFVCGLVRFSDCLGLIVLLVRNPLPDIAVQDCWILL